MGDAPGNPRGGMWCLKRQDDHGRQYVMESFASKQEAEAMMEEYQAQGHKQTYWVEKESRE